MLAATLCGPDKNYAVSSQPRLRLLHAEKGQIASPDETVNALRSEKVERFTCRISVQGGVSERVKSGRPNVQGKAVTREATREAKLKRGGMKERWGLELSCRSLGQSLEVVVKAVSTPSPAQRAGVKPGDLITLVNEWKVEAMRKEAALSVIQASGFHMTLGLLNRQDEEEGWEELAKV